MRMPKNYKNKAKLNLTVRDEQRNKLEQMASLENRSVSNLIEVMADERWKRLAEQQGVAYAKTVAEAMNLKLDMDNPADREKLRRAVLDLVSPRDRLRRTRCKKLRMAKSKKNKNKAKLNLTVRDEQRNKLEQMASLENRSVSNLIEIMADERWKRLAEQQGVAYAKTVAEAMNLKIDMDNPADREKLRRAVLDLVAGRKMPKQKRRG